jgi:hypothetical protein
MRHHDVHGSPEVQARKAWYATSSAGIHNLGKRCKLGKVLHSDFENQDPLGPADGSDATLPTISRSRALVMRILRSCRRVGGRP